MVRQKQKPPVVRAAEDFKENNLVNTIVARKVEKSKHFQIFGNCLDQWSGLEVSSMAIDAEWCWEVVEFLIDIKLKSQGTGKKAKYLVKQYTLHSEERSVTVVLWDSAYPLPSLEVPHDVILIYCDVEKSTIFDFLVELKLSFRKVIDCYIFYSPADLTGCLLGRERMKIACEEDMLDKKRNLSGTLRFDDLPCQIFIKDLAGAFNVSLEAAFDMVGIDQPYKSLVSSELKSTMNIPMRSNPDDFLKYALGDTVFLKELWETRVGQINTLIEESLGFKANFTVDDCPRSMGSLVSQTFNMWLTYNYPELMVATNVMADVNKRDYGVFKAFKETLKEWNGELQPLKDYKFGAFVLKSMKIPLKPEKPEQFFRKSVPGLGLASIPALGMLPTSANLNSIVMGGRCTNENPYDYEIHNVFDIDLNSCYGSALRSFDYVIGKPTLYGLDRDDKDITLGEFLQKNGKNLLPNLYQIIVEGSLSFEQDLVYSKINVTPESIRKNVANLEDNEKLVSDSVLSSLGWEREVDKSHIEGDFILLRKELVNGILTSDLIETIWKVSSDRELKEWKNLKVIASAYYPSNLEVTTDELFYEYKKRPGKLSNFNGNRVDTRNSKWCRIPLEGFIGKFINYRKSIKKQSKVKGDEFDIKQNAVKLFVNTTYGCLASPFFAMGNTIIANNITAKARLGAWMMAKALGSVESITDGGAYSNDSVRFLDPTKHVNSGKPSFNTLSDYLSTNKHRNIKIGKLTDFDLFWKGLKTKSSELEKELDKLALDHIDSFWSHYGLKLPFDVEHKYGNTSLRMIYWGSSDYVFFHPSVLDKGKRVIETPYNIKVRGAKQFDHVKKCWLLYLAGEIEKFSPEYEYEQLIGLNQYKEALSTSAEWPKYLLPGEDMVRTTELKPSLNHLPQMTESSATKRKKAHNRAVLRYKSSEDKVGFGIYRDMGTLIERKKLLYLLEKEILQIKK